MIIMLVRHAESIGNSEGRWVGREDVPLSSKGRCQAERLRARLESEGFNPTRIYTSPLIRTLETARIVAKNWNCPLVKWDDLVEIDVGSFSGMTTLEIEEHFPDLAKEFANTLNFDL